MFKNDEVLASCYNPGGLLALPVGRVWVKTSKFETTLAITDILYGSYANEILDTYEDVIQIEFRSPDGDKVVYRAF